MKAEARKAIARVGVCALAVSSAVFAFPIFAFASEEAAEEGGISVLLPNLAEFIPMLVCFLILLAVLGKFGWPAFSGMLDKRQQTIEDSLKKSEEARVESERLLAEYKQQLEEAKSQSAQLVADAKKTGDAIKADLTEKAQSEASSMIAQAKVVIDAEKKAAIAELQGSVADMSIEVASRLIGSDLSDDEHRAIIERYVNEAGSFNAN